jgi:hypothetical protein
MLKMGKNTAAQLSLVETANAEFEQLTGEEKSNLTFIAPAELVELSLRKGLPKRVINLIASMNNAEMQENEEHYILKAPYIKVSRADVESSIGKLTDGRWRMLFVNRSGEIKEFNNYEFAIGAPKAAIVDEEEQRKETVQLNIRVDKLIKEDIEKYRLLLGENYTQNAFVEDALKEFIANIKKEML